MSDQCIFLANKIFVRFGAVIARNMRCGLFKKTTQSMQPISPNVVKIFPMKQGVRFVCRKYEKE